MNKDYLVTTIKWILSASLFFIYSCHSPVKNDKSFTPERYEELGLPDYKKIWKEDDFSKAISILYDIGTKYPDGLPRYESKKSGVYFDRITDMDNLYFLNTESMSLSEKAFHIQIYQGIQAELLKIYTNILTKKQYYHREIIELHGYGLNIYHEMLKLANQIKESKDPADQGMHQQGFNVVVNQYIIYTTHLMELLNDTTTYSPEDRNKLSASISRSIRNNQNWFTPEMREKIKQKLSEAIVEAPSGTIKDNLKKAYENIQ